ncbi:MAG TPA: DUF5916 domain-containing protein [Mucilaginibacter sp.]|jgi:hypothetical protein
MTAKIIDHPEFLFTNLFNSYFAKNLILFLSWILLVIHCVNAQQRTSAPYIVHRLKSPVTFDGLSNEPEWQEIQPLPLAMIYPHFRGKPSGKTEIRVAYDDHYIYFSGRFYYSDSTDIRANTFARDKYSGDDSFDALIDSYCDRQNAFKFTTNPLGNRNDAAILNDASGNTDWFNRNWDTYWDVKTVIKNHAWFMELRIPFKSLRFQSDHGKVIMGMTLSFYKAANNSRISFPEVPQNIDAAHLKASLMQDFQFEGVYSEKPIYITPYLLGSINQQAAPAASGNKLNTQWDKEAGLDVKYSIKSNVTLDLSVNTDFSQVEADDELVNLSRFSLFYPEKRRFFQEQSGLFDFNMGDNTNLFYSRNIGLSPAGQPVRIYGGARLVGRVGNTEFGILSMQVAPNNRLNDTTQLENMTVLRVRQNIINASSYIGGMFTSRVNKEGKYNFAYGADYNWNVIKQNFLTVRFAHANGDELQNSPASSGNRLFVNLEDRNKAKLFYQVALASSDSSFNPGIGFVDRSGFISTRAKLGYGIFSNGQSILQSQTAGLTTYEYIDKHSGQLESLGVGPTYEWLWNSGMDILVNPEFYHEYLSRPLPLNGNVSIPIGKYNYTGLNVIWQSYQTNNLRGTGSFYAGQFYDGGLFTADFYPTWYASKYLEISPEYELNIARFPDRNTSFTSQIVRLRLNTALNVHFFSNAFIQYDNLADNIAANIRLRYNFSEGRDIYLVYNTNLNTDRYRLQPVLPLTDNRSVILKFIYTL